MATYEIITYDVWGNARDGFEVNQSFRTGRTVEIPDDASNLLINRRVGIRGAIWDGDETTLYAEDKRNGKPLLELQRIPDEPQHSDDPFESHVDSVKAVLTSLSNFPLALLDHAPADRFPRLAGAVSADGRPVYVREVAAVTSRHVIREVLERDRHARHPLPWARREQHAVSGRVFYVLDQMELDY